jgi:membrane protein implicated in regulation of membrane protease activity
MNWLAAATLFAGIARALALLARDFLARQHSDAARRLRSAEHAHERLSKVVAARNRADGIDVDRRLRGEDGGTDPYRRN